MAQFYKLTALLGVALALSACNSNSTSSIMITGKAQAGPISGGTINAYSLNADGSRGGLLANSTTDALGNYSLAFAGAPGPTLLVATGGSYVEESSATTVSLTGKEMSAAVGTLVSGQIVAITPLTHIAAQRVALQLTGTGNTAAVIAAANAAVAQAAGLSGMSDITAVIPADPRLTLTAQGLTGSSNEAKYALFLASLSQYGKTHGNVDSVAVMQAFALDFAGDGQFDGFNKGAAITIAGGGPTLDGTSWNTGLSTAQTSYIASPNNSGVFSSTSTTVPNFAPPLSCSAMSGHFICNFGTAGAVVGPPTQLWNESYGSAIAKQSDGKIVIASQVDLSTDMTSSGQVAISRYLPTGQVDTTFGTAGTVLTPVDSRNNLSGSWTPGVVVQGDGKIVVSVGNQVMVVMRYQPDGTLDSTFGSAGIVRSSSALSGANSIALQSDQKILVTTSYWDGTNTKYGLVRLNTNGSFDSTFGAAGITGFVSPANPGEVMAASYLVVQIDGKIIITGHMISGNSVTMKYFGFELARFNIDGTLDSTFGTSGIVSTALGNVYGWPSGLVLQPDGKILITGSASNPGPVALARYSANGVLDSTFGVSGLVNVANANSAESLGLQANGTIVLGTDNSVRRFTSTGAADSTWGSSGSVTLTSVPMAMLIDSTDIIFGGSSIDRLFTVFGLYQ